MFQRLHLRTVLSSLLICTALAACSSGGGGEDDEPMDPGSGESLVWGAGTWGSDQFSAN